MNTQSGFHQNHPHPLHPSQEGAEVNILNIPKKINDFFIHCTEQRCVTFFFLSMHLCILDWLLYFWDLLTHTVTCVNEAAIE